MILTLILVLRGTGAVGDHGGIVVGTGIAIGVGSILVGRRGGRK